MVNIDVQINNKYCPQSLNENVIEMIHKVDDSFPTNAPILTKNNEYYCMTNVLNMNIISNEYSTWLQRLSEPATFHKQIFDKKL